MRAEAEYSGRCLCGAVRVSVTTGDTTCGACHCDMCRRWGGGPLICMSVDEGAEFAGEENIGVFASSDWAERGFCKRCGTHLFYRLKNTAHYGIPVGLFDSGDWRLTEQIFIDEKPAYYEFANETKNMTGAEVFALYAPPDPKA